MFLLSDLKTRVKDLVGDYSPETYWTSALDGEIEDYLNDAFEEVSVKTGAYKEAMYVPLSAGKRHYQIVPSSRGGQFLYPTNVRLMGQRRDLVLTDSRKLSRNDYRWMTRTGTPQEFYMVGVDTLRTVPYSAEGGDVLLVEGVVIPPSYVDNKEPIDIQDSFVNTLCEYASYMMLLEMRKFEPAAKAFQIYAEGIGLYDVKVINKTNKEWKLSGVGSHESWD